MTINFTFPISSLSPSSSYIAKKTFLDLTQSHPPSLNLFASAGLSPLEDHLPLPLLHYSLSLLVLFCFLFTLPLPLPLILSLGLSLLENHPTLPPSPLPYYLFLLFLFFLLFPSFPCYNSHCQGILLQSSYSISLLPFPTTIHSPSV